MPIDYCYYLCAVASGHFVPFETVRDGAFYVDGLFSCRFSTLLLLSVHIVLVMLPVIFPLSIFRSVIPNPFFHPVIFAWCIYLFCIFQLNLLWVFFMFYFLSVVFFLWCISSSYFLGVVFTLCCISSFCVLCKYNFFLY